MEVSRNNGERLERRIKVLRSDDTILDWDKDAIVRSLKKETELAEEFYNVPGINTKDARFIADSVEKKIFSLYSGENIPPDGLCIKSSAVREIACFELFLLSYKDPIYETYRRLYQRIGLPFYEAWNGMWQKKVFEKNENANLANMNPENIHKKLGDYVSKEAFPIGFPVGIDKAHYGGDIHIHQLEYLQRPFCADYDLRWIYLNGLRADGTGLHSASAGPAKHAYTAVLHAVKVLAAGQCNCQGGQGLFNFNIFIAPYLEGIPYDIEGAGDYKIGTEPTTIKQVAQMFLFELNLTYVSRGGQLIFSSIQIEPTIPKLWEDKPVVYKGKVCTDLTYGNFEKEAQLFAKALLEAYLKGDHLGKMFFFPKPEVRLRKEHFSNPSDMTYEIITLAVKLSSKFGSTYFDCLVPTYRNADGQDCYQCCAYNFKEDPETLQAKLWYDDGAHFAMGGQQVVTLNMPRLAYRSKGDFNVFIDLLEEQMNTAKRFLVWKREKVIDFANRGNLPFLTQRPPRNRYQSPLFDIESSSLIIGFVGMNEFVQYMTGYQLHESDVAVECGIRALTYMEKFRKEFSKKKGINFAIARTPAESTAQNFAVKDLLRFNGEAMQYIKGNAEDWKKKFMEGGRTGVPVYYTNGFMVNHSANVNLDKKIEIEQRPFIFLSGGNIFNVFLGEKSPEPEALYNLTKKIALNSQIGYWSYTIDMTLCVDCNNMSVGLKNSCPECGSKNVEQYSRITGYYQAVSGWNAGKQQELKDRYKIDF